MSQRRGCRPGHRENVTLNLGVNTKTLLDEIAGSRHGISYLLSATADGKSFDKDVEWGRGARRIHPFSARRHDRAGGSATRRRHHPFWRVVRFRPGEGQGRHSAAQEPVISTGSDREFPLAVTSEEAANLRFDIGRRLYQLGLDLDEPRLLQSAASHLGQAQDLYARRNQVEKQLPSLMLQGRALLAVAEYRQAAAVFTYAEQVGRADAGSEASLYLGIAEVRSGNVDKGAQALNRFVNSGSASRKVPRHDGCCRGCSGRPLRETGDSDRDRPAGGTHP